MAKSNRIEELIQRPEFMALGSGVCGGYGGVGQEKEVEWEGAFVKERRNPDGRWNVVCVKVSLRVL